MINYKSGLLLILLSAIVSFAVFQIDNLFNRDGYIDNNKLFKDFEGTQQLVKKAEGDLSGLYNYIDTLTHYVSYLDSIVKLKNEPEKIRELQSARYIKDSLQYEYQMQMNDYMQDISEQSWNLLNQYLLDYGKGKRYRYIFGANGTGTLMYGADRKDITDNVLEYANKRYNEQ